MANELKAGDRYWQLIEPYWKSVSIYVEPELFLQQYHAVPPAVGHLIAAHWCQSEVCNGGFFQFFSNSTGILAPETLAAFRAIGLDEWATILDEAMTYFTGPLTPAIREATAAFFGTAYPRSQWERHERLDEIKTKGRRREEWDPFYQLDNRFYKWLHEEENRWKRAADAYADKESP